MENYVIALAIRLQFEFAGRRSELVGLKSDWVDLDHRRVVWPDSKTGGMSKPMSEEAYRAAFDGAKTGRQPLCTAVPAPSEAAPGHRRILRRLELAKAAQDIAAETGLEHRPVFEGQRVTCIFRRSVMLASRHCAMLDGGMGFSLVPWKPVVEQRLGKHLAAMVRGGGVSWDVERQLGPLI